MEIAQKLRLSPHLIKKSELLQLLELLSGNINISSSYNSYGSNEMLGEMTSTSTSTSISKSIIRPYANDKLQKEQYITDLIKNPIHRIDAPFNTKFNVRGLNGEIIDELLLIRDILYSCQGIETQFIETRNNEFEAKSNLRLLPSQKRLIRRICKIGKLHRKLTNFIKKHRINGGLVLQSFLGSLDEELTSLYQLFGCLHEKLEISLNPNCCIEEKISLERLNIWFNESLLRLSLLNKFCLSIDGSKGGMIISQIYKFCRTGNKYIYNYTASILNEICRPIFDMISKWIIEGQLNDPFHEFFIIKRENVKLKDIWKKKYVLVRKYIPIFINKNLAKQIYSIGRNLNFIRVCCKDNKYNLPIDCENILSSFDISHLNEFEQCINKLSEITNKRLIELMMNKFKVMIHAKALRKYLLLGQGDFIQQFLTEIRSELNKNASYIKQHDIQNKLESAILQSNALYDDNDIKQRLKIKLYTQSIGDIGWNVFSLNYYVDLPINIIFNQNVLKKYEKVFIFLMQIKRAKSVLNDSWIDQMRGNHHISCFPDIHYVKHCGYLVRNSMNELLQIFESYFMFDVLDTSWKKFEQNVNECKDMDQLILSHSKYINEIITKCFLNINDEQKLKKPLEDILLQIHQFCKMYKELYQQLNNIQTKRDKKLSILQSQNIRDSYVGSVLLPSDQDHEYLNDYNNLRKKQSEIIYILKSFHNKIAKLLQLTKTNKIIPEYLERLLIQLDFNDFHANSNQNDQPQILSVDLPINPFPIQSFIKPRKDEISPTSSSSTSSSSKNKSTKDIVINAQADDMLSKLNAVLDSKSSSNKSKSFVPNFVFPNVTKINQDENNENNENDKNINNQPPHFNFDDKLDDDFNKHRTTAPSINNNWSSTNDSIIPTPIKQKSIKNRQKDILAKYDLGNTPKIDSRIPKHLLPTPLQNKTSSKTDDIGKKYLFDDSILNDNNNDNNNNDNNITSPSGIKFSFGTSTKLKQSLMSPIPFARNIGKMDSDEPSMIDDSDNDNQWSSFQNIIPTPLINQKQKTKSFR